MLPPQYTPVVTAQAHVIQPHYRKADHLKSRGSFTHALSAIDLSLQLVDADNKELVNRKKTEITGLREMSLIEQERQLLRASKEEKQILISKRRIEANRTRDFTNLLSPDILNLITDHLLVDDPNVAVRIAGVKRSWRSWTLSRPGAWQNLVLGVRRPLEKARIFLDRSEGIIRKLSILERFSRKDEEPLAELLDGHVHNLRFISFHRLKVLPRRLSGQFHSLEEIQRLEVSSGNGSSIPNLDFDFEYTDVYQGFEPSQPTLRRITINARNVDLQEPQEMDQNVQFLNLRKGSLRLPQSSLVPIAQRFPNLSELNLDEVEILHSDTHLPPVKISLDKLTTLRITSGSPPSPSDRLVDFFDQVSTPNLRHLAVSRSIRDLSTLFVAPGLVPSLAQLRSLDISKTAVVETNLLDTLRLMPQLRFLNVSCTTLGDTFLQAITWDSKRVVGEGRVEELLPNLVGLSIAALEITSLALRDLAISRLPKTKGTKSHPALPTQTQAPKTSAFRPSSSVTPPVIPSSKAFPAPGSQVATQSKSSQTAPKRYLKWLCLDHCETIDSHLIEYLRTKIMFVSAGKVRNEDRMRGKGQYHWDLDYYDSCVADDPKERCKLVLVPGKQPCVRWNLANDRYAGWVRNSPYMRKVRSHRRSTSRREGKHMGKSVESKFQPGRRHRGAVEYSGPQGQGKGQKHAGLVKWAG